MENIENKIEQVATENTTENLQKDKTTADNQNTTYSSEVLTENDNANNLVDCENQVDENVDNGEEIKIDENASELTATNQVDENVTSDKKEESGDRLNFYVKLYEKIREEKLVKSASTSFILSVISLILSLFIFPGLILAIISLVLSCKNKNYTKTQKFKWAFYLSIVSIICHAVLIIAFLVFAILVL